MDNNKLLNTLTLEQVSKLEEVLGFQFFPWIKQRLLGIYEPIEFPTGRCIGTTTYHCLVSCLDVNEPKLIVKRTMQPQDVDKSKLTISYGDASTSKRVSYICLKIYTFHYNVLTVLN